VVRALLRILSDEIVGIAGMLHEIIKVRSKVGFQRFG
jgi:hypothetical protein